MADRQDPLPMTRQCALLDLPRSTFYHVPGPVSEEELELMALIDRCHLKHPFYGSRRIRDWLEDHGYRVNRKKVQRLMRTMDLVAQYPKRNLSLANQAHKMYPYLLRGLVIDRPKQVWAMDITYIRWPGALCTWSRSWTGTRARYCRGVYPTRSTPVSVSMLWRKLSRPVVRRRYSTPTKAASSPVKSSPACSSDTISASAWIARDGGSIMCLWSACGAA